MGRVGIRELKRDTSRIIREIRESGESYEITYHGRVVARLVPAEDATESAMSLNEIFDLWDELTADDPDRPVGNYALDAIRESRGRLE